MSCFVIAEAGVNHNGDERLALQLVDAAARTGADAVKFQTFTADGLVTRGTAKAAYQAANTGGGDQHSMLRRLELPRDAYARLRDRARALGIEFMSTPFEQDAVDMLLGLGMTRIKIPSGELTNLPFLRYEAGKDLPVILSTGMGTLDEVKEAVAAIRTVRAERGFTAPLDRMLTLLHCTSNYPAAPEEVNLLAMHTMHEATGLPVGYPDHTLGTLSGVVAAAAGAVVLEKHFTLDRNLPGPDHRASLEPAEFTRMVAQIRAVNAASRSGEPPSAADIAARVRAVDTEFTSMESTLITEKIKRLLGTGSKQPVPAEQPIRDLVRRSVTLRRALKTNTAVTADDLVLLRPGTGIPPKALDQVVGRRIKRDLPAGHTLTWSDLGPAP